MHWAKGIERTKDVRRKKTGLSSEVKKGSADDYCAINNSATQHKPLLNKKRSALSAASKEGTTSPKQLKRPEPQKKEGSG